jgi:glycosyltransferase involved in cell wall biosynthesis
VTDSPAVTVLLPVRDPRDDFFSAALESVLTQTFSDFELLIIDDSASPDVRARIPSDPRIRYQRGNATMLPDALNCGLQLARAPLVARLDADDVCAPDRLQTQVEFLSAHPDVAVVGSHIDVIDEQGSVIGRRLFPLEHGEIAAALRRYNCMSHPSVMFRKDAVLRVGGYATGIVAEDYDLWCRMVVDGARFANCGRPLIRYRFHPGALKFSNVRRAIRTSIEIKRRCFSGSFTMADRLRIAGEQLLLRLPVALVLRLFRAVEYR